MIFQKQKNNCSETKCREYLLQIANGNETALEELYNGLGYSLFLFAFDYCKNKETAENIVQTTFVKIISGIDHYKEQGYAKTWIFSIAKNLCFDALANKKDLPETIETGSVMDHTAIEVKDAISTLSDTEQQVIRLHVFGGLKLKEVAICLGLPYGKVRYAQRSAIKNLKQYYSSLT
jgi:RNA polymerase sigma-70 factor (ECF subfamily)